MDNLSDLDRMVKRRRIYRTKRVIRTATKVIRSIGKGTVKGLRSIPQGTREPRIGGNIDLGFGRREKHYRLRR